jgi:cation/acetate symporter
VQLAEIAIDGDVLVLATPEIGGLPYVISGLVAAGGLAAALSTADGLLLAISNALSHDIYYKIVDPGASTQKRVTISKLLLLAVAFIAAYAASQKPATSCRWSAPPSRWPARPCSRRWCWACSGSAPTTRAPSPA